LISVSQVELNEIEARSETYPVTRAFLKLVRELTDIPIPNALGTGYRVPGFEPYLMYLRDDVFLKFNSRGYHDSKEKVSVTRSRSNE
jgi:nuclear pore complex protein Nup205